MKIFSVILLLFTFSSSLLWATPQSFKQLGRSLANYQVCSEVALSIADLQMNNYYKNMFNDTQLQLLSQSTENTRIVYATWDNSEKVLLKIGGENLQKICLSRFDALSRQMINHPTSIK